jgi:CHAT domain-containing protein
LGQQHSYVWVITSTKVTCLTLPSSAEIDPVVKSYREAVLAGHDVLERATPEGQRLYSTLIEPAKKLIPQGSRVILLPDGSLYGLNFETLIVPEPKPHFWIEDVTLTTASSLTLLAAADVRSVPRQGNLLLVGNAAQSTPEFPPLRQAAAEMARIEQYFPESRREILTGQRATPRAVLASQPERFTYVHFVTHGTASRAHPLDSAVILTPEGDSFKLYARDIVKHPLSAYLVTVSACNGSGSRAYSGEGLVGLSWAFLRAGAHNVIGALWEVSDASTPPLMDKLYAELARGQDPAAALRTAKLSLLKSDGVYKKPFYWAPFQLYSGSKNRALLGDREAF